MKHLYLFSFLFVSLTLLSAQEKKEKPSINFYGFVRNEVAVDTYHGVESFNDIFYLLPLYQENELGEEINKDVESYLTTAATRLGLKIAGPEVFGAKTSGVIEFDFGGITSQYPTLFRMRHAYTNFAWENSSLLVGQTWHPFWGGSDFPKTGSLNTGAPFHAFNRSPQVTYKYTTKCGTVLSAAAVYENQYTSKAFYDISDDVDKTKAMRYGAIPEIVAGVTHYTENMAFGVLGEYKSILPTNTNEYGYQTDASKTSFGATAYTRYKKDKFFFLAKGTYGQDLTHLTMPGGYGVSGIKENGDYEYTNYKNLALLANAVYGKKWQIGGFVGYGKNFGTTDALYDMNRIVEEQESVEIDGISTMTTGTFLSMQEMYRASVHGALNIKNLRFVLEYEMTSANYGKAGTAMNLSDGLYNETHRATNHRTVLLMMYMF